MAGVAYLVGAGPGPLGYLTLRGLEVVRRAEVLVYDAPCAPAMLEAAPPGAERIPVGRWPDAVKVGQDEISALLVERAGRGLCVVRLKNGDPSMFGRGGEEAEALARAGVRFEVVPGVTSGLAAAACAGVPITHRGVASAVVFAILQPGPGPGDWGLDLGALARLDATLVLHLAPEVLAEASAELVRQGRAADTPVAVVESAGAPTQRTFTGTLRDIAARAREARSPAVALVGEAARWASLLGWAERRPLAGKAVVLTRPRAQAREMAELLEEQGAEVVEFPCIDIQPPESLVVLDEAIASLDRTDWVVFSSANGVEAFLSRIATLGRDLRVLGHVRIAAVGKATAQALVAARLRPDLVPEQFHAEALAEALERQQGARSARFLVVRAQEGRDVVPEALRRMGATVQLVAAYRTVAARPDPAALVGRLEAGSIAAVTFASPSAVRAFATALGEARAARLLGGVCLAAIGQVTAKAIVDCGWTVAVTAAESTGPGLVTCLVGRLGRCCPSATGFA